MLIVSLWAQTSSGGLYSRDQEKAMCTVIDRCQTRLYSENWGRAGARRLVAPSIFFPFLVVCCGLRKHKPGLMRASRMVGAYDSLCPHSSDCCGTQSGGKATLEWLLQNAELKTESRNDCDREGFRKVVYRATKRRTEPDEWLLRKS